MTLPPRRYLPAPGPDDLRPLRERGDDQVGKRASVVKHLPYNPMSRSVVMSPVWLLLVLIGCAKHAPSSDAQVGLGCPSSVPGTMANPGTTVLATVNGTVITQEMVDAQLNQLPSSVRAQLERSGGAGRVKDNLEAQELLYQEAVNARLYDQPEMAIPLALAQQQILAQAVLKTEVDRRLTDARLQQWYQEHIAQFTRLQVSANRIVVAEEKQARDIAAKARSGADFAALARQFSTEEATAKDGGSLGWISERDIRDPVLAKAIFAADEGAVLDPVETTDGYQIVQIEDRREVIPFEEARDTIRSQAEREVQQAYIDELRRKASIVESGGDSSP